MFRHGLLARTGVVLFLLSGGRLADAQPLPPPTPPFPPGVSAAPQYDTAPILNELDSADPSAQERAVSSLRAYGLPASVGVPLALKMLDCKAVQSQVRLLQELVWALVMYGDQARPAAPKLLALCKDPKVPRDVSQAALLGLAKLEPLQPELLPLLLRNIESANGYWAHTIAVFDALGAFGPQARQALPELEKYMVREDVGHDGRRVEVQYHAYRAAGRIHHLPRPSLEDLKQRHPIDWKGPDRDFATLMAIQEAGPKAAFMTPRLLDVLNQDPPDYLRATVLETLGKTHPGDPSAVRALLTGLLSRDEFMGEVTYKALAQIDTSSKAVVPVLAEALRHPTPAVQLGAAGVLEQFGRNTKPALPSVIRAIRESDLTILANAGLIYLDVLRGLGPDGAAAADVLLARLEHLAFQRLVKAGRVLGAEPPVQPVLTDEAAVRLRGYLLLTLAEIGEVRKAWPNILDALGRTGLRNSVQEYACACRAVATLGTRAKEAVPGLMRALRPDFYDPPLVFRAGPMRMAIIYGVATGASRDATSARFEAIRALAAIGPAAKEALPALRRLAQEQTTPQGGASPYTQEAEQAIRAIERR